MNKTKSIDNIMICPKCNSDNCYTWSTDEIVFWHDNTGHYYVDCRCKDCMNDFRLYMNFNYEITKHYTR